MLRKVNDNCLLIKYSVLALCFLQYSHFCILHFIFEHFKRNRGNPGILYDGIRFRKDRDSENG